VGGVGGIAAAKLRRPVKLRADRDDDMLVTGKRHCFFYEYEVGYDDSGDPRGQGGHDLRAGFSADLSGPVATRAVCHFDNTYYLSDVDIRAGCGKTNTQSNTAFRGFGGPQGRLRLSTSSTKSRAIWARCAGYPPPQFLRQDRAQCHAVRPGDCR
jgi:xanthine dehydrogenase large subunit